MRNAFAIAVGLLVVAADDAAAQMFKCTDAAKKVTYSNVPCSQQGLKDAGQVQDRIQVTPAFSPPAATAPARARPQSNEKPTAGAAPTEPAAPERRCFTTKTAKGATVTRCNDKPDEKGE
jgi:hypothetical protein